MQSAHDMPNFLIIGAAKSGTTALFDTLAQHPDVFCPFAKEPKFFNNDINYAKGFDWYLKTYFKGSSGFLARGEATPHYLYWGEKVTARLRETFGANRLKFIAIFRDPARRAYSQYWQDVQREIETLSFADALEAEEQRLETMHKDLEPRGVLSYAYFRNGCYATLLKPYLENFPREDFHFLLSEDLKSDLDAAMRALAGFLGIRSDFRFSPVSSNPAYSPRNRRLHRFMLSPSGPIYQVFRKVIHLLPEAARYRLRRSLLQANLQPASLPPMDAEVERLLRARYKKEVVQLETLLGRDLSAWYRETA